MTSESIHVGQVWRVTRELPSWSLRPVGELATVVWVGMLDVGIRYGGLAPDLGPYYGRRTIGAQTLRDYFELVESPA